MIKIAHLAPFGKGSKTVLDKTVRSAWDSDAGQIKFANKEWRKFVEIIVRQINPSLGLEEYSVSANLYKLQYLNLMATLWDTNYTFGNLLRWEKWQIDLINKANGGF